MQWKSHVNVAIIKLCIDQSPNGKYHHLILVIKYLLQTLCFPLFSLLGKSSLLSHCGFLLTLPIENLQNSQSKQVNEQSENYNFTLPLLPCISPMSGIHFGTCDRNFHRYGIQSIEWGFVADLDYKSERFRWMGEKRFLLYACYYLMSKRLVSFTIWIKTVPCWSF